LIENKDITRANEAIERALFMDGRKENFEKFIDIFLKQKNLSSFKLLKIKTIKKKDANLKECS